jgi:photosystem II stability/assembly factor-like uncharacterized protein
MAEETLRRNLDRAFDPGSDFPHPLLLSRAMALLAAEAQAGRRGQERRLPAFMTAFSPRAMQLVAAFLMVALAVAAAAAFVAINHYIQSHRNAASGTCGQGFHMVSDKVGWQGASTHTTDGGATWTNSTLPTIPNQTKGGYGECTFDGSHAWMTVATGSPLSASQIQVLITRDGGTTWLKGGSVPATGFNTRAAIEFINPEEGWLLVDSGARTLYSTSNGGLTWTHLAGGGVLDQLAPSCSETGMTFVSADRGWMTWGCSQGYGPGTPQGGGPVVAFTDDGGRTWAAASLPSFPTGTDYSCDAKAPLFTDQNGVMPVSCGGTGHGGWNGVYRTADLGGSWTLGQVPFNWFQLSQISFANASTGFAFSHSTSNQSDLYKTTNSGRDWTSVKKDVFAGQAVDNMQFISVTSGFAFTSTSQGSPWLTTDGGVTWSLPGHRTLPGNVGCPAPPESRAGGAPVPVLMADSTTGWAIGARRTTDGGLHWSTPALPSVALRSSGYAEFFLDANHAWVAVTTGSASACSDHIVVFRTGDGGHSWQQAPPITVSVAAPTDSIWAEQSSSSSPTAPIADRAPWLDFVDANDGWLEVQTSSARLGPEKVGPLYHTTDGGLHWTMVSEHLAPNANCSLGYGISFSSPFKGWVPASGCASGSNLEYLITRDGGASWSVKTLEIDCGCQGELPAFVDSRHGFLFGIGVFLLIATSDGGDTWTSHQVPAQEVMWTVDVLDPSHVWAVTGDTTTSAQLKRTNDGGKTWTLVNPSLPSAPSLDNTSYSLNFINAQQGFWATGSALYRTSDGGRTWSVIPTSGT